MDALLRLVADPAAWLALLTLIVMEVVLGIDKFMSECRALVNITGNGVATIVVAWWEGELDRDKLNAALAAK